MTGLTPNPTIFDYAIKNSFTDDSAIRDGLAKGKSGKAPFLELALADITRAADLFRPMHEKTNCRRPGGARSLARPQSQCWLCRIGLHRPLVHRSH